MSICVSATKNYFINSLGDSEFYKFHENGFGKARIDTFERFWRWIGHFLGLCDSTSQKCHKVSLQVLEKLSALKEAPKILPNLQLNPEGARNLQDLWIGLKVSREFESRKIELIEEIGWTAFLSWVDRWDSESLLDVFLEQETPSLEPMQEALPCEWLNNVSLPSGKASLSTQNKVIASTPHKIPVTAGNLAKKNHAGITYEDHETLARLLSDKRFVNTVKGRNLSISCEKTAFKWPNNGSSSLDKISEVYRVSYVDIERLEVDVDELDSTAKIYAFVQCLKKQKSIKTLTLTSSRNQDAAEPVILPLSLANLFSRLNGLQKFDMGCFVWPLSHAKLPAIYNKTTANIRISPSHDTLKTLDITKRKLLEIAAFCPTAQLKSEKCSYLIPEGFLRRTSRFYHDEFEKTPLAPHHRVIETAQASQIYKLALTSLSESGDSFTQENVDDFIQIALKLQMPLALAQIQKKMPGIYIQLEKLSWKELPKPEDLLKDISLEFTDGTLDIEIYQLAQKKPSRAQVLRNYPRQTSLPPEQDPQIDQADLKRYFEGQNFSLNRNNILSLWAIAISFSDNELFTEIERWLEPQNLTELVLQAPELTKKLYYLSLDRDSLKAKFGHILDRIHF